MFASAIAVFLAGGAATVAAVSAAPATPPTPAGPLAFVEPQGLVNQAEALHYTAGDQINITWATPFEYTTLTVWEGPFPDGTYRPTVLANKYSADKTQISWKAKTLADDPNHGFYLELQKGDAPNDCATCVANSLKFAIAPAPQSQTTSAASSQTTKTSSPSHSATTISGSTTTTSALSTTSSTVSVTPSSSSSSASSAFTSSTPNVTPPVTSTSVDAANANAGLTTASATPSYLPDSTNSEHGLAVGLGIGVGAGVPIIIILYAVILFLYTRRHRRDPSVRLPTTEEDKAHLNEKSEPRSATNSWISKISNASAISQASSYHEPFEFQDADGTKRPGSERLFRNGEQIPGSPGRVFRR